MKIKTKFLFIVLLTIFSFLSSLSVYLLLTRYVDKINEEKGSLIVFEKSIQEARMAGSELFLDNPMRSRWNAFTNRYEDVQAGFKTISSLKALPEINKTIKDSLDSISNLNAYLVKKYENTANIYEELSAELQEVKDLNLKDLRLMDIFLDAHIQNYEKKMLTYYLADLLQTEYTYLDYIFKSAINAIDFQMTAIESESKKAQYNIISISVIICFSMVTGAVFLSLMIAHRIVEDTNTINLFLHKMTDSTKPLSIEINRDDEIGELAHNIEEIFIRLLKTRDQLVQQEKMASLGTLIAGVAHEINTPLGSSMTISSFLKKESENLEGQYLKKDLSQEDFETYLQHSRESHRLLMRNLNRTADLIKSFKALSIDQSSHERQWLDLNRYANDILISLKALSLKNHISMDIEFSSPIKLYCLPGDFSQILTHLVQNSISHGFKDDRKGFIKITFRKTEEDLIHIVFKDNGQGMTKEVREKAFDPFFTTDRGANGGIGLGLYIVFNLVSHVFNGTISCTSEIGKGTNFTIVLPANPLKNNSLISPKVQQTL